MPRTKHDWSRSDAMSEAERHAAALADPDAQPLSPEDLQRKKRTPQVRIVRRALGLSQEEFATRFQIPLGTLRDWEQGRKEPDAAARAYLMVIGRDPDSVTAALHSTTSTAAFYDTTSSRSPILASSTEHPMSDKDKNQLYVERRAQGDYAVRKPGSSRASDVLPTQAEAIQRAKELNPKATPLVERVRNTTGGGPDKWRKP